MSAKRDRDVSKHLCDCEQYPAVRYTGDGYECARCQKLNAQVKHKCDHPTQSFDEWIESRRARLEYHRRYGWMKRRQVTA